MFAVHQGSKSNFERLWVLIFIYYKLFASTCNENLVCLFKKYIGLDVIFAKQFVRQGPPHIKLIHYAVGIHLPTDRQLVDNYNQLTGCFNKIDSKSNALN